MIQLAIFGSLISFFYSKILQLVVFDLKLVIFDTKFKSIQYRRHSFKNDFEIPDHKKLLETIGHFWPVLKIDHHVILWSNVTMWTHVTTGSIKFHVTWLMELPRKAEKWALVYVLGFKMVVFEYLWCLSGSTRT